MPLQSLFNPQIKSTSNQTPPSMFDPNAFYNQNQSRDAGNTAFDWNGMQVRGGPTSLGNNPWLPTNGGQNWTFTKRDPNSSTGWMQANYTGNDSSPFDTNSLKWNEYENKDGWAMPLIQAGALAAFGGSVFGPAFSGAEGLSGMDLAADAALGSGNNIFTAGSMLGGGGAAAGGLSGMDLAADAAAGTGNNIGTAAGGLGTGSGLGNLFQQAGTKVGGNLASNIVSQVLGGSSGGVSNLGNLASLFTNYNQYNKMGDLINEIKGIYKPDGEYAKYMENQLARKDAAAGRNSQYGPRAAELMARLGDSQARALSGLGGLMATQQGGLNGMVGAGQRLADGTGLSSLISSGLQGLFNNQGGMKVGDVGTTPSIWDRPSNDIDWESLFGG